MKTLCIAALAVVLIALALVSSSNDRDHSPLAPSVKDHLLPESTELRASWESPNGHRLGLKNPELETSGEVVKPVDGVANENLAANPNPLNQDDVEALNAHFSEIYKGISRNDLHARLTELWDLLPVLEIHALHRELYLAGNYILVDEDYYVKTKQPSGMYAVTYSKIYGRDHRPLLDVPTVLPDGTVLETSIDASDVPAFEQELYELGWLHEQQQGKNRRSQ